MTQPEYISDLLKLAQGGDHQAQNDLVAVVYEELRLMAHRHLRDDYGALTLSTTALVNEAYVRLVNASTPPFSGRAYFFGAAARAMRQIIVDMARSRNASRRGGDQQRLTFDSQQLSVGACAVELIDLDNALSRLEAVDQRLSRIVECRYFGGLTNEQTSQVVGVNEKTVRRDWRKARAWLYQQLQDNQSATKPLTSKNR